MTWFKIDDGFADHPKVIALRSQKQWKGAVCLWTMAGAHCSKHLTDGFVSLAVLSFLGGTTAEADALVRVGLWTRSEGGYAFHQWSDHNPLRSKVLADRAADSARKKKNRAPGFATDSSRIPGGLQLDSGAESSTPDPTRPDPARPEREHARSGPELRPAPSRAAGLSATSGAAVDGQPLYDWLRLGVIKGFETLKRPAPRETRDALWVGWRELEMWVLDKSRLTGRDPAEVGRHHIRCFLRSQAAARKGWPIAFLVANGNEFWQDALPPEVAA
jgi:hypothetical protein